MRVGGEWRSSTAGRSRCVHHRGDPRARAQHKPFASQCALSTEEVDASPAGAGECMGPLARCRARRGRMCPRQPMCAARRRPAHSVTDSRTSALGRACALTRSVPLQVQVRPKGHSPARPCPALREHAAASRTSTRSTQRLPPTCCQWGLRARREGAPTPPWRGAQPAGCACMACGANARMRAPPAQS